MRRRRIGERYLIKRVPVVESKLLMVGTIEHANWC
jgi:hypothetical protein